MAQQPQRFTISRLEQVNQLADGRTPNQVQFLLDETTSLTDALEIKVHTRAATNAFRLLNPELLDRKFHTKFELDAAFQRLLEASMRECDQVLLPLTARIAALEALLIQEDNQIPPAGPPIEQRNRGVTQCIYPDLADYEFGTAAQPIPFQPAYTDLEDINRAAARDRSSQRAWWRTCLNILQTKKKMLEDYKVNLDKELRKSFKNAVEDRSQLGSGYHSFGNLN